MPSVGVNTNDRSSLEAGVKDALEDPGLPAPTYGEVDRETLDDKRKQKKKESDALYQTYLKKDEASQIAFNDFQDAQKAYDTAQKNLVQGSPELANLRQARDEKYSIYEKASLETDKALIDYENALTTNKTNKNTQPSNVIVTTGSPDNNLVVYRSVNEKGDEEIGWIENKSQTTTTTTSKRGS
jgi:hypothetical protein